MDPIVNLESTMGNNTPVLCAVIGTNDEKNPIQNQNIGFKTQIKHQKEKQNEISISLQVRKEKTDWVKDSASNNSPESFPDDRKRHLAEGNKNESLLAFNLEAIRLPLKLGDSEDGPPKISSKGIFGVHIKKEYQSSPQNLVVELKRQNKYLVEALMKIQKNQSIEKKRFNEILFGIDRALSSLPIRLEKIRVRNQKNLSVVNYSRLNSGDGSESPTDHSTSEATPFEILTQNSSPYTSSRMKTLLEKIDQLNDLIKKIQNGESPIELLVNSELHAISLLKKEIKSTKNQIENKKSDTETVTSFEGSSRDLADDSSSKTKNSFSNELDKASNFKIFENHMKLQEEALNLLTRKIKETEEALVKETGAKEALKRQNEAMAKEIFRLKSAEEETKGEKSQKTEKLKAEVEAIGNRPYRLIKELKTKLEEKEKSLIIWKSKCSRLEAASSNKLILLEAEKKKNSELETALKQANAKNKSITSHLNSLQCLNDHLKSQAETLQQQVEILSNEKLECDLNSTARNTKIKALKEPEQKTVDKEEEVKVKIQDIKKFYENELEEMKLQVKCYKEANREFREAIKQLLILLTTFSVEKDAKNCKNSFYGRIRDILKMSYSEYELFFTVYSRSRIEKEVESLHQQFQVLVKEKESKFSDSLSNWLFEIIYEKMFNEDPEEKFREEEESKRKTLPSLCVRFSSREEKILFIRSDTQTEVLDEEIIRQVVPISSRKSCPQN